jgi:sulfite reductase (NADPH) flavoprotein alpha-component
MVGPGTGIAPFIAFLQERTQLKSLGKNWLFYGAQFRKTDHIYENELIYFQDNKVLDKLDVAFSRDQGKKIYVQDKIYESRSEFFKWIREGAYLYVCGDAINMAKDVNSMLQKIIQEQLNCSEDKSILYIKNLKKEKRYLLDVY